LSNLIGGAAISRIPRLPPALGLRKAHVQKAGLLKSLRHDKLLIKGTKGVPRALGTFFKEK